MAEWCTAEGLTKVDDLRMYFYSAEEAEAEGGGLLVAAWEAACKAPRVDDIPAIRRIEREAELAARKTGLLVSPRRKAGLPVGRPRKAPKVVDGASDIAARVEAASRLPVPSRS